MASITGPGVSASNGVVHVIDTVLYNVPNEAASLISYSAEHTTFYSALQQAYLVSTLMAGGDYTIFAPSNTALAARGIDDEAVGNMTTYQVDYLVKIHVIYDSM